MASRREFLRNVVILFGSYYAAALILVPLTMLAFKLIEGPGGTLPGGWMAEAIPYGCTALLSGLICGSVIVGARVLSWSVALAVLVAVLTWSSGKWYVTPSVGDLLRDVGRAFVVGVIAALSCWYVAMRRQPRESDGSVAAA